MLENKNIKKLKIKLIYLLKITLENHNKIIIINQFNLILNQIKLIIIIYFKEKQL